MEKLFAAIRTALYMTGFVILWAYLAVIARQFDATIGLLPPAWLCPFGIALAVPGVVLVLSCGALFASRGEGTPAPFDPPQHFVAVGPYRLVRNPMYVGALLLLAGAGLWLRSTGILILTALAGALAHTFVVRVEEPGLERRFGESYSAYRRRVNRWLPWPTHPLGSKSNQGRFVHPHS
jgi:protein-S-isoprenylcysteine O-methyltransferase Ste14